MSDHRWVGIEAIGSGENASGPMRAWATLLAQIENELIAALGTPASGPVSSNELNRLVTQLNDLNQLNLNQLNGTTTTSPGARPAAQPGDSAPPSTGRLAQLTRQLPLLVETAQAGAAMEVATPSLQAAVEILTAVLETLDQLSPTASARDLLLARQAVRAAVASLPLLPVVVEVSGSAAPTVPVELSPAIRQLLTDLLPASSGVPMDNQPIQNLPSSVPRSPRPDEPGVRLQTLAQSLAHLQILDTVAPGPFIADRALIRATLDAVNAALDDTSTSQRAMTDGFRALGLKNEAVRLDTVQDAVAEFARNPGALVQGMLTARFDVAVPTVLTLLQGALSPTAPRPFEPRNDDELDPLDRETCADCVYWSLCRFACWRLLCEPER